MNYMSTKGMPIDSYSKEDLNGIISVTCNSYFINQFNGQTIFLNYVLAC